MNPRVKDVKVEKEYILHLYFTNGEEGLFDMTPYLTTGVFKELTDPSLFRTVRTNLGSICWINGQDLCPDTLYVDSKKVH